MEVYHWRTCYPTTSFNCAGSDRGKKVPPSMISRNHDSTINFNNDSKIEGNLIPAGKYALFTIPGKEKWTVIINKNWDQHLADDYDQVEDVLRFDIEPELLDEKERYSWFILSFIFSIYIRFNIGYCFWRII